MLTEWLMVAFGVLLTVGTAIFVASEFALVTIDPAALPDDDGDGPQPDRRARSVRAGLKHLSTELSSAQVGITVTTILLGYTAQPAIQTLLEGPLGETPLSTGAAVVLAAILALVLVNLFSMLFGELIPKNYALSTPYPTARVVVPLQRVFTRAFRPLISVLNGSANRILRWFGIEPREELSGARSASELASLVRRSAMEGTLDVNVATLLTNSIELDRLTAVDVMTDRTRMVVLDRDATAADVVATARTSGHSRFPIIGEDRDDVVGLVHLRKAVAVPYDKRHEVPAAALMTDAARVPETVGLGPLLVELRGFGLQMAVVVDEYGGTAGVVTLEDVVEELVGDVADEHDPRRSGAARAVDGSWIVPGVVRPDELAEVTGVTVPDDGAYETLGGLVMERLGRIPEVGDVVHVDGVVLRVEAMVGRRVERLRVVAAPAEDATTEGGER
ncbi:CBS domain containing-hemolysin-like protein [Sediminihabitans luteus]|uniref:CBS domain containing-hemolysin-like protein n=1 Tax=Sediminihabitans luteus TaxID=1138585 RepID=A0A2M9CDN0_9CELL|nr:hemolysin family protein [Sediminihabitans luteus]PJJ70046.1 CBS domain containing-hemolysin-like protein [Sediminihabitans luteus]GIJ00170.1 membrane protein [Sediminihabitans luteus]